MPDSRAGLFHLGTQVRSDLEYFSRDNEAERRYAGYADSRLACTPMSRYQATKAFRESYEMHSILGRGEGSQCTLTHYRVPTANSRRPTYRPAPAGGLGLNPLLPASSCSHVACGPCSSDNLQVIGSVRLPCRAHAPELVGSSSLFTIKSTQLIQVVYDDRQ